MAGTDTSVYPRIAGFMLHDELETLVQCGLTPAEALRTATAVPAQFLGRDNDLGSIRAGKVADMLLLNENPLENIGNTRKLWAIVFGGKVFQQAEIEGLLREAERLAAAN